MPRIALTVEYNGAAFHGWQRQPGLRTIHDDLRAVISQALRQPIARLDASGRTDAGVSAKAQIVTFVSDEVPDLNRLQYAISSLMRGDLAVIGATVVPDSFHPRRSATGKDYRYRVLNRPAPPVLDRGKVWHIHRPLALSVLRELVAPLVGTHDFSSFRGSGCDAPSPVKTIYRIDVERTADNVIEFTVVGSGFLKQMVRIIIGTVVDLARGRPLPITSHLTTMRDPGATMLAILERRDRRVGGITAPPDGLYLHRVIYPPEIERLIRPE